jgi:hypothetical protein
VFTVLNQLPLPGLVDKLLQGKFPSHSKPQNSCISSNAARELAKFWWYTIPCYMHRVMTTFSHSLPLFYSRFRRRMDIFPWLSKLPACLGYSNSSTIYKSVRCHVLAKSSSRLHTHTGLILNTSCSGLNYGDCRILTAHKIKVKLRLLQTISRPVSLDFRSSFQAHE